MDWDAAFAEVAANNAKSWDNMDHGKLRAKSEEEFQRGLRLGWWDAEGNSLLPPDEEEEDE